MHLYGAEIRKYISPVHTTYAYYGTLRQNIKRRKSTSSYIRTRTTTALENARARFLYALCTRISAMHAIKRITCVWFVRCVLCTARSTTILHRWNALFPTPRYIKRMSFNGFSRVLSHIMSDHYAHPNCGRGRNPPVN